MIWYNMIWYDMIWYDMIWYDMIWYNMIWYDMIWYDMIWYDMIWYDTNPQDYRMNWNAWLQITQGSGHILQLNKVDPAAQLLLGLAVILNCTDIKPWLPEIKYADGSTETNGQK